MMKQGRQPINDNFGGQQLVTQARPIAGVHETQRAPDDSRWKGLAKAFAQAELYAKEQKKQKDEDDSNRATAWANSKTVKELGDEIENGTILASESPVFVATVQNIHGRNQADTLERDVITQITTGQIEFKDEYAIDAYITESRNTALTGASEYGIAGFDKALPGLKTKMMAAVSKYNDSQALEAGQRQGTDALRNEMAKFTSADWKGTDTEAVTSYFKLFDHLKEAKVLTEPIRKEALQDTLLNLSQSGKPDLLNAFLNHQLEGIGSVRSYLGESTAIQLGGRAEAKHDEEQRQATDSDMAKWYKDASEGTLDESSFRAWASDPQRSKYIGSATVQSLIDRSLASQEAKLREAEKAASASAAAASFQEAASLVDAAIESGDMHRALGTNTPTYMDENGNVKKFSVEEYVGKRIESSLPGDATVAQRVTAWARTGFINPNWQAQFREGLHHLSSIRVGTPDKPGGQLNEQAKNAIALFEEIRSINPAYANQLAGDEAFKRFDDINFLVTKGGSTLEAAAIATAPGNISPDAIGKLNNDVEAAVSDILDGGWTPAWFKRIMGDSTLPNTIQVRNQVLRHAKLLAQSGQYGDAKQAVTASLEYMKDPAVSATVNGTWYMRSELPKAPPGESQEEWFGRFITAVPKSLAVSRGYMDHEVQMIYQPATDTFVPMMGGLPMQEVGGTRLIQYSRAEIEQWSANQRANAMRDAVNTQGVKTHRARMRVEMGALQRQNRFAIERLDGTHGSKNIERYILSDAAYARIEADGNAGKSFEELVRIYLPKKQWGGPKKPK